MKNRSHTSSDSNQMDERQTFYSFPQRNYDQILSSAICCSIGFVFLCGLYQWVLPSHSFDQLKKNRPPIPDLHSLIRQLKLKNFLLKKSFYQREYGNRVERSRNLPTFLRIQCFFQVLLSAKRGHFFFLGLLAVADSFISSMYGPVIAMDIIRERLGVSKIKFQRN